MRPAASKKRTRATHRGSLRRTTSLVPVLVAAVFLTGYLGRFVEPTRWTWWIQLVAIPLPYVSTLMAVTAVALIVRSRSLRTRTAAVALLVLIGIRFPPTLLGSGSGFDETTDLSLLSYNIPAERVRQMEDGDLRLKMLAADTKADIVCLQESYWYYRHGEPRSTGRRDVAVLEVDGFNLKPPVNRTFGAEQVTVTKLPNRFVDYALRPSSPRDPDVLAILRSVIEWQQREFVVYNIHLASYGTSKPWQEKPQNRYSPRVWMRYLRDYRFAILHRAWQVEQVRETVQAEELPYLIVGDFNATPHNWSYWRLANGLTDAFRAAGRGIGMTYHQRQPTFRIDFILLTKDFVATSAKAIVGGVSDHLAVNATVRWRNQSNEPKAAMRVEPPSHATTDSPANIQ